MSGSVLLAQDIAVTSASPNTAAQGTIGLDVTIGGSGFKKGAKAAWFITGTTNPGGITVNSTTFVNSNTLVANITVAADAQTDLKFDVAVTSGGRTGKGIELFSVSSNSNGATCTTYNVTSILYDADSNSAPLQYQSDSLGPYVTGNRKGDTVSSVIQASCSWALDTTNSKTRGIVVTLAYPFASNPPPPFIGPQVIKGVFHTTCQNDPASNGMNFGTMTFAGQTMVCPLILPFNYNGVYYKLSLAPQKWPGTSYMQVTCSGATGGQCNSWTVAPDPATSVLNTATNQVSAIAELFVTDSTGTVTGTPLGTYLVSFSFLIHK
ncbi:MAG: hypothetical protein ACE145_15715 [Terriglobia bacterium]